MAGEGLSKVTASGGGAPLSFRPWLPADRGGNSGTLRAPQEVQERGAQQQNPTETPQGPGQGRQGGQDQDHQVSDVNLFE